MREVGAVGLSCLNIISTHIMMINSPTPSLGKTLISWYIVQLLMPVADLCLFDLEIASIILSVVIKYSRPVHLSM